MLCLHIHISVYLCVLFVWHCISMPANLSGARCIISIHLWCVCVYIRVAGTDTHAHIYHLRTVWACQTVPCPKNIKNHPALSGGNPRRLWDCLAQVTRCGSLPLIRNTSRSQTSSTWLLATSRIYVGLQHNDLEWYDQVYWDGCNRGICCWYDKMI